MHSHVMDSITFIYLLRFVVDKKLETRLTNVIIVYLYGNLEGPCKVGEIPMLSKTTTIS